MKIKVIRSMTDANKLLEMGNSIIKIDRDKSNRSFLIFLFNNTKKLNDDLDIINNN